MIYVVAIITTKPGRRAEVLDAFQANVAAVHAESGCHEYTAVVDADGIGGIQTPLGPDAFAVIEKWDSGSALKAHASAPHMKAYAAKVKDNLEGRVIHVFEAAA